MLRPPQPHRCSSLADGILRHLTCQGRARSGLEHWVVLVVQRMRLVAEAEALRRGGFVGVGIHARDDVRLGRLRARDGSADVPEHRTEREAERVPVDLRFVNLSEDPVVFGHGLEYLLSRLRHSGGEGRALRAGATLRSGPGARRRDSLKRTGSQSHHPR